MNRHWDWAIGVALAVTAIILATTSAETTAVATADRIPHVEPTPTPTATPTPAPTPLTIPTPAPTPVPPATELALETRCCGTVLTEGHFAYDRVQRLIYNRFEQYGAGDTFVRISYFEGYNEVTNWTTDWHNDQDACPLQVNQIHDDNSNGAIRRLYGDDARWPGPVLRLSGCLRVAEQLFLDAISTGGTGLEPWANSRSRWTDWCLPIYGPAGDRVGPPIPETCE